VQNLWEHEAVIRTHREGKVQLCWRKLDRKSKKLSFSFKVTDMNSNALAGQDTLDSLNQELGFIQERLDNISRNVYLQQEMDRQHFDRKAFKILITTHPIMLSDCLLSQYPNLDVDSQDGPCACCMRRTSLLHHCLLFLSGRQTQGRPYEQPLRRQERHMS
jgi:hypothetical protein